ncbi:MAG: alpha-glucan family phosphorylase [Rikenellaceae bacterium]
MNQKYLFETSWEVCNKVGGIHTVVGTKSQTAKEEYGDNYILIGPDFLRETPNPEFIQDDSLLAEWRNEAYRSGLRIKVGRWKVVGEPIVVLVDFSSFLSKKDEVLGKLWEEFKVDSISGGWDYAEPVIFGYVAARVVESFTQFFVGRQDSVVAHFHEWMTCSGVLYLKNHCKKVATVFTTHATVTGRSIAGNGMALYGPLENYNGDEMANRFGVMAKHSIEKQAAHHADAFTTVSDITAKECASLLEKTPTVVTPNGFENDFVYKGANYTKKRKEAKKSLISVAEVCLGKKFEKEPMIVAISGRYEFKNKGIDEFIDSLAALKNSGKLEREVLAYVMVPSWNHGARRDLHNIFVEGTQSEVDSRNLPNTTHYLGDQDGDPVIGHLRYRGLLDSREGVNVMFIPCYLNGDDGVFSKSYYELLVGCDVTVFPSYYEPWGYTPLESIAFGVPTITTSLAGFGLWVKEFANDAHTGVTVVERNDSNSPELVEAISSTLLYYASLSDAEMKDVRAKAKKLANIALWKNLYKHYQRTYEMAIENQNQNTPDFVDEYTGGGESHEQVGFISQQAAPGTRPNWTRMMVERAIPEKLHRLEELTKNLWWSWTESARRLFESVNKELWGEVARNPIALLDRLSLTDLKRLADDEDFIARLDAVYAQFKAYMDAKNAGARPKIAYFSMEYGLHSSLKIYSGGLGILAGDYLKESSDKNVPMTAVGLLYRYGYFTQKLSNAGEQEAAYEAQNFDKLPITAVRDENGEWKTVEVAFPGRTVTARIWRCDVGRTELYLLDTDHEMNLPEDRFITHHLYGGDWDNRLKQEFLLGIGGVRLLRKLGVESDVYHCNEGHAAFLSLERAKNFVEENDLSFSEALEAVRSSSLFTTHTPVPAGHDAFDEGMIRQYMSHYPERLKITWEQFVALGREDSGKFSMSVLACNFSQEVNGVSWLHGEVSKDILGHMWPGYMPNELHIGYVTNGVHFPTWTSDRLKEMYNKAFGAEFAAGDYSKVHWDKVHNISNSELWDARLYLKNRLLKLIRRRVADPMEFRFDSPSQMVKIQESLRPDVLTIGFARRFATYKRAHLLFTNMDRLSAIVNNPQRPVQFVFAGKAHPADKAGQDLIKRIVEVSKMPQFVGKIIFLQNYDMELARRMVQGVDVWLNTPTRPLEASGTSGEKAVMNGVMQFSVLDGWWVEGYREDAGWMLPMERTFADQRFQDELDAEMVYTTIEDQIVPTYYERGDEGYSPKWMGMVKHCIADVASNFTTNRMMQDYEDRFYNKLYARHTEVIADDFALARSLAAWKRKVSKEWDSVKIVSSKQFDSNREAIITGNTYQLEVAIDLAGLKPSEIGVELLVAEASATNEATKVHHTNDFVFTHLEDGKAYYRLENEPELTGSYDVAIRVYPKNDFLPHRQDFALVKWA